jgi:CubicO group peptidase (beta-lactamase class C family)
MAAVEEALLPHLESAALPGYVAAVSVDGDRRVHAAGRRAIDADAGMTPDTLFRIASLSKLVGAAMALILEQDGVIGLDDEASRWLPELAAPRVIRDVGGPLEETEPARRPIRVRDLLTMTAGMGHVPEPGPLREALVSEGLGPGPFAPPFSHDEYMRRLGRLPLAFQPGAGWRYHTGLDVLSVLVARAGGRSLADQVSSRLAEPTGIRDLVFSTRDVDRLATAYVPTGDGLVVLDAPSGRFSRQPRFEAFGSGLVATAPDFLIFMEVLAGGGAPLLSPGAVARMGTDRLTDEERPDAQAFLGPGRSWGLTCEVVLAREQTALAPGAFGWMGGTGTTAYADPRQRLAGVLFTQRAMTTNRAPGAFVDFWDAVYRGL